MRTILTIILISFLLNEANGQTDRFSLQRKMPTPKVGSTSKAILENLVNDYHFLITYQSNDPVLNYPVQFPKADSISIKELLDILQQNLPYEFLFKDDYIILKKKALPNNLEIKGSVKSAIDADNPVFANVLIKGTTIAKGINQQGLYSLRLIPGNYVVEFSCIGYKTISRNVNLYNNLELNIILQRENYNIEQVEVFKTREKVMKEFDIGRNIERIDSKTIDKINSNNPADALQGRVNGVWATRVSGAPGDHQKIRIRGINSLFAAVDPLYVVNGVQIPLVNLYSLGIADINSRDIESITVLKDVASTAYYGYQGGNGVIKIETKKGGGKNQIQFSSRTGLQTMNKRYPLMNSTDFLQTMVAIDTVFPNHFKAFPRYFNYSLEAGAQSFINFERFVYPNPYDTKKYISDDWQGELFQTGAVQEYQIIFKGSERKLNYYISGNYYDHNGVVIQSKYNKYSYNINLSINPFKNFLIDFSGFGSIQKNKNNLDNYYGNKNVLQGINIEPNYNSLTSFEKLRFRDYPEDKGMPGDFYDMYRRNEMYAVLSSDMPDLYINNLPDGRDFFATKGHTLDISSNNYSLSFRYNIHPDISISNRFTLTLKEYTYESYIMADTISVLKQFHSIESYRTLSNNLDVSYLKNFEDHAINVSACYRFYRDQVQWNVDSIYGFSLDEINKTEEIYLKGSNALYGKSGNVVRDINSFILHANYSYKNKYTLSAFANFDHLEEGNYISAKAVFPSVALNWDLSKEIGLNSIKALDEFNLYVNWGLVGNYPLNSLSNDLNAEIKIFNGQNYEEGKYITNIANHDLKHEESEETNFGLSISTFQNRLSLNANYFMRENRNLIFFRETPYYYGGGFIMKNLGNMHHNGFELSIDANPIETSTLLWNTVIGYSSDKQLITNIYRDHDTLNFFTSELLIPEFIIAKNARVGDILGYRYEGFWTQKDSDVQDPNYINQKGIKYYKKNSTSSKLTDEDKVVIGNSLPDFTCHWINNFQFKNFAINMHWYAVVGVDKFNSTRASTYYTLLNKEISSFVQDSLLHFMDPAFYESSYFIEDASFIKLKTLSFMYSPNRPLFGKATAKFSLSFENLITLSHYKGYDPEASVYTGSNFSDNAIDMGAYPTPKSIFLGIELTF